MIKDYQKMSLEEGCVVLSLEIKISEHEILHEKSHLQCYLKVKLFGFPKFLFANNFILHFKRWKHSLLLTCNSVYVPNFFVTECFTSSLTSSSRYGRTPSVCSQCKIGSIGVQRIGSVRFSIVSANPAPNTFAFYKHKKLKSVDSVDNSLSSHFQC